MSAQLTDLTAPTVGGQVDSIVEAIRQLTTFTQQSNERQSSVERVQNAKGATQFAVKVYHREPEQAAATAWRLNEELASRYTAGGSAPERSTA